jgi:hypothetical protein
MFKRSLRGDSQKNTDGNDGHKEPGDGKKPVTDIIRSGHRERMKAEIQTRRTALEQWYEDLAQKSLVTGEKMKGKIADWEKTCPDSTEKAQVTASQRERIEKLTGYHQTTTNTFKQALQDIDTKEYSAYARLRNQDLKDYQSLLTEWEYKRENTQQIHRDAWKQLDSDVVLELHQYHRMEAAGRKANEIQKGLTHMAGWDAHYRKLALSNIDAWEKISPSRDRTDGMKREVEELYNRHNQSFRFASQWQDLNNRHFSREEMRASHHLVAREAFLDSWQGYIDTQGPIHGQEWIELNERQRHHRQQEIGIRQSALRERFADLTQSLAQYSETRQKQISRWEIFQPGDRAARTPLANILRERVDALHVMQTQNIQVDRARFEQTLQDFNHRNFSAAEISTNRDLIEQANLLNTWNNHIDTLSSIQQARGEFIDRTLAPGESTSIVPSTDEREHAGNGGTRAQRQEAIATQRRALGERFTSLTTSARNYYRRELETGAAPRERVRALRDIHIQEAQGYNAYFEKALENISNRTFNAEEISTNHDLTIHETFLTRWREHIGTLTAIHQQERDYIEESQTPGQGHLIH